MAVYPFGATRSAVRGIAQDYIMGAVKKGLKSTDIIDQLRELGLTYHRQNMFQDINWWRNSISQWENMRYVTMESVIPDRFYLPSTSIEKGIYQTVMDVQIDNPATGAMKRLTITVVHSHEENGEEVYDNEQLLSRSAINNALDKMLERYELQGYQITRSIPIAGYYNPQKI